MPELTVQRVPHEQVASDCPGGDDDSLCTESRDRVVKSRFDHLSRPPRRNLYEQVRDSDLKGRGDTATTYHEGFRRHAHPSCRCEHRLPSPGKWIPIATVELGEYNNNTFSTLTVSRRFFKFNMMPHLMPHANIKLYDQEESESNTTTSTCTIKC